MEKEEKIELENKENTEVNPTDVAEETKANEESFDEDFADAKKEEVKEEVKEEPVEEKKEEEINLRKEKEEGDEEVELEPSKRNEKGNIEYPDEHLAEVEKARRQWIKQYKKWSTWKMVLTFGSIVLIFGAYLIPTLINKEKLTQLGLYLALGLAVVALVGFVVFGVFQRRAQKKLIRDYFVSYYENVNAYAFEGLNITDLTGDFDTKISEEEFKACALYPEVASLGSRESISFKYEGVETSLSDVGAQKDTGKALQTVFVGKYLRMENKLELSDEGLIIYFKGNDRAIPPDAIKGLKPIENNKKFVIYGLSQDKKVLTPEIRSKLKEIHTDNLLVDVAISIRTGKTYFALGYEDTLMVLPNDKPFDPVYVCKYKEQLKMFLDLGLIFNKEK